MTWLEDEIREFEGTADFETSQIAIEFNEALFERLQDLQWSQTNLAEEMGVSRSRVSKMLSSEGNVTLRTMVGAALAVGCELSVCMAPVHGSAGRFVGVEQSHFTGGRDRMGDRVSKAFMAAGSTAEIKTTIEVIDRKEGSIGRETEAFYQTAA